MRSIFKKIKFFSLFFCCSFFLSFCADDSVKNSENPEVIYNSVVEYIDKGRYLEAGELINEIRTRFPQSRFSAMAELKQADMLFAQDLFTEAAAAYGVFVDLYPTQQNAPYALYQKALSFYNDAPEEIARDQSPAHDAVNNALFLIQKYPASDFVTKAKELERKARIKLANKEAYVARFYEKRNAQLSALRRWEALKKDFADIAGLPEGDKLLADAAGSIEKLQKEVDSKQKN
jgi:outer membrane protein assembly factor BamD